MNAVLVEELQKTQTEFQLEFAIDKGVTTNLSLGYQDKIDRQFPGMMRGERLTCREIEILRLIADGLLNKEIATEAHISEQTVKNHITSILYKLQAHNRTHAASMAIRNGLLSRELVNSGLSGE
jgi:DNA-binding NarL/FixJ family response regulator